MKRLLTTLACVSLTVAMPGAQRWTAPVSVNLNGIEASAVATADGQLRITTATGQQAVFRLPIESKFVKGIPFSAEILSESLQTLADGNRIVQKTTGRIYRDSEGRIRREEDRPSGFPSITITDPVARVSYQLNPETHVAIQLPALGIPGGLARGAGGRGAPALPADAVQKAAEAFKVRELVQAATKTAESEARQAAGGRAGAARRATPSREQTVQETLPDRAFGAVLASGTRRTTTIAAGAIGNERPITVVSEEWYSADLQVLVLTDRTDPRLGRSTYQLSNIDRNEPDHSLFEVPPDYTIRGGFSK